MAAGWAGIPCITERTAKFVFTLSTACSASLCCTIFTSRRKLGGQICRSNSCSKNWRKSSSSFYSTRHRGEKGPARTAYLLSQQTLAQQALVKTLGLQQLHRSTPRG